jgi:hypothetical protein
MPTAKAIVVCATLALGGLARAADDVDAPAPPPRGAAAAAPFLPLTQTAALDANSGHAVATGGYDGGRGSPLFEAVAEVRLWGPVALRGGAVYTGDEKKNLRPSFGARLQALDERRHGVDGAVGLFYRPEGLTEPEGEIEAVLSAGAHLGATYLLGNLVYGQDPEGRDSDGELRLALLRPVASRVVVGVEGRLRYDLAAGSQLDAMVGPTATFLAGPVALVLNAGASAVRIHAASTVGAFVLGGVGTSF